ncbi:MAG: NUDIX hydrolase, partial [Bacteroidales bacterium]|nr:NUDIX hydrolase [Bacteroidales bacterium]
MYTYNYPRAALTVDAIVFVKERIPFLSDKNIKDGILEKTYVLLVERAHEPFKNKWALPGGFIEMDETLETACKRELLEETGLTVDKMTQFRTYDAIDRDPRHRTISVVYYTLLDKKQVVTGGDDASRAEWFSVSELPE